MSEPKTLRLKTCDVPGRAATVVVNGVPLQVDSYQVDGWRGPDAPVRVTLSFTATIEPDPEPEAEQQPDTACAGCIVHVRRNDPGICVLGSVVGADGDLLQIDTFGREPGRPKRVTRIHDESRQVDGSWHWPHDERHSALTPDAPAPITVNVHVEGSVLSEKKLQDVIASQLRRVAAQRGIRW